MRKIIRIVQVIESENLSLFHYSSKQTLLVVFIIFLFFCITKIHLHSAIQVGEKQTEEKTMPQKLGGGSFLALSLRMQVNVDRMDKGEQAKQR